MNLDKGAIKFFPHFIYKDKKISNENEAMTSYLKNIK